jgi:putative hemolysin
VIDTQFNATDIAIVLRTGQLTNRYLRHYIRPRSEAA